MLRFFVKIFLLIKRYGIITTIKKIDKKIKNGYKILRRYGIFVFFHAVFNKLNGKPLPFENKYSISIKNYIGGCILEEQQNESASLDLNSLILKNNFNPLISVIMPIYDPPLQALKYAIESLQTQVYTNWELCAVDDCSKNSKIRHFMERMAEIDSRIHFTVMNNNSGISAASNKALENAQGEFIALLDHDDALTADALFWIVNEINQNPNIDFIYTDECKIDKNNNRKFDFFFKPDWSPSLLLNYMYTCHLTVYRTSVVRQAGGFRSEYNFSQDYDLALRMSDITKNISHVERVLYYWRSIRGSAAVGDKGFARKSNIAAIKDWYKRNGIDVVVNDKNGINNARPILPDNLKVSIIIPTDNIENVKKSIQDIINNTSYPNFEIIVVTGTSTAEKLLLAYPSLDNLIICYYNKNGPFNFSDKCNTGVSKASGDVICFYNDDAIPVNKEWLERLLEVIILPGVACVGPLLLWNDGTIQSAGLLTGTPGLADNAFFNISADSEISLPYDFHLIRDVSLLSGACIAFKKEVFLKINGFDIYNFPNGFSDMDICFRIQEEGYRCVCTPYSIVCHDSRNTWRVKQKPDKSYPQFLHQWGKYFVKDPYFTDNMKKNYYTAYNFLFKIYVPISNLQNKKNGRDILFVAHCLERVGAPIVLLDMVRILIDNGDYPVIMSSNDGPLKQDFLDLGVKVIIDQSFEHTFSVFEYFARNFDLVVVNTLGCGKAITALNNSIVPVLWWIHESQYLINAYKDRIPAEIGKNIKIYAVSNYSAKSLTKGGLQYNYGILPYGISEITNNINEIKKDDKQVFLTIGSIYRRKGQDVLIKAIKTLKKNIFSQAIFVFIGGPINFENTIYNKLLKFKKKNKNIVCLPLMPRDELWQWYIKADCIIVPSRSDPLPVVATEAMMFSKPVICSDQTGTADYITPYENGIVFKSEDNIALANSITYAINNRDKIIEMGYKARNDIYEKHFSINVFKERILNSINEV